MHHQVLGLGQCCFDTILRVERFPPPDGKCEYAERLEDGGGPVATALVALSRWGVPCAIAGVRGDDEAGARIEESLRSEGIDTRDLLVRAGSTSQLAFIVAESGSGRRTVFWKRPSGPPLRAGEIAFDRVRSAKVLHTDGLFAEASLAAARAAKEAGARVVVDAGSLREGMLELAPSADAFLASAKFARELLGADRPVDACRRIAALGPRVAGVTLGEEGYIAIDGGRMIERPAYPVEAVDTTGCGDVFHAGFVYGLLQGWDAERCLDFGAWAASRAATKLGGRMGIPPAGAYPGPG